MSNPINVTIPVTQNKVTLYITVDTFALFTQQATIQPQNGGQQMVASGSGEGKRVGFWTYSIPTAGLYTFSVWLQFDNGDGTGFRDSGSVYAGSFSTHSLNQTVVFSEDQTDNDANDCFVTFMWFQTGAS
jgi:hypothetical protein